MSNTDNQKKTIRIIWFFIGSGLFLIVLFFCIPPFNDWSWESDATLFGQYGDFIGGLLGTLFSMAGFILLYKTLNNNNEALNLQNNTLNLQIQDSTINRQTFYKQQFDNTFFGLLDLHKDIISDLSLSLDEKKAGRDFFSNEMQSKQKMFDHTGFLEQRKKKADEIYISFYLEHKKQIAHYFRTLYRIYCFIDESELSEDDKVMYAKIIRAQLSEAELFFMYYNAFSPYGSNFKMLINKYNIIKHLPILEILEFRPYASKLKGTEVHSIELVLKDVRRLISTAFHNIGVKTPNNHKTFLQGKYSIKIYFPTANVMEFTMIINNAVMYPEVFQQGVGLDNFNHKELYELFYEYIIHYMVYMSFFEKITTLDVVTQYNRVKHTIETVHQRTTIRFSISRKDNKVLEL